MTLEIIIGLLLGLLIASLVTIGVLMYARRLYVEAVETRLQAAEDRSRAAELRSARQIDAMLDRVTTSPRMELRGPSSPPPSEGTKYIGDTPYHDEQWNDFVGAVDEIDEGQ